MTYQTSDEALSMQTKDQHVWRYTTTNGEVRYLLAPDMHEAAQLAYVLSKPNVLQDITLYE